MATIADLAADVYTLTARPDLVNETALAIKSATLKCHQVDFFDRDLFEVGIQFDTAEYLQTFPYSSLITHWRALKYFRKVDVSVDPPVPLDPPFEIITPDSALDNYSLERQDVVYLAGENYKFKSRTQFQYMLVGCYLNPTVSPDSGYSSWIADQHPFAIIYDAARIICRAIGKDSEAGEFEKLFREQIGLLIASNVQAKGY